MDRYEEEAAARQIVVLVVLLTISATIVIPVIVFVIYWFCCRQRGITGVVLGLPNSMQQNTAVVPLQNASGATNVPGQNMMGPPCVVYEPHNNNPGAPYPVAASNPHVGAQYPVPPSGASGAVPVYPSVNNREAPPSYNHMYQEREEQVPPFK